MSQRRIVAVVSALLIAFAAPAFAAGPLTEDRHQQMVERVAPEGLDLTKGPGRTLCVCQDTNSPSATFVGYLNSYVHALGAGLETVNMNCVYPIFDSVGLSGFVSCALFQVIK